MFSSMSYSRVRKDGGEALVAFVDRQRPVLLSISDDMAPKLAAVDVLLAGGKRLRPAFCYCGWRAAGAADRPDADAAAAPLGPLHGSRPIQHEEIDVRRQRRRPACWLRPVQANAR